MRTTVSLADDVAAQVERLRQEEGIGLSEAVNRLVRRGLVADSGRTPHRPRSAPIGLQVDVSNVAEVLDLLDQE